MLAHAGHWAVSLLYVLPVVIVVGWLTYQQWKERRRSGSG
jgi:hypothetical protein